MSISSTLRSRLSELKQKVSPFDGSKEMIESYEAVLDNQQLIDELLQHKGFQAIIAPLKKDFHQRLNKVINEDPELSAYKQLFGRILGSERAAKMIEQELKQLVNE